MKTTVSAGDVRVRRALDPLNVAAQLASGIVGGPWPGQGLGGSPGRSRA